MFETDLEKVFTSFRTTFRSVTRMVYVSPMIGFRQYYICTLYVGPWPSTHDPSAQYPLHLLLVEDRFRTRTGVCRLVVH